MEWPNVNKRNSFEICLEEVEVEAGQINQKRKNQGHVVLRVRLQETLDVTTKVKVRDEIVPRTVINPETHHTTSTLPLHQTEIVEATLEITTVLAAQRSHLETIAAGKGNVIATNTKVKAKIKNDVIGHQVVHHHRPALQPVQRMHRKKVLQDDELKLSRPAVAHEVNRITHHQPNPL